MRPLRCDVRAADIAFRFLVLKQAKDLAIDADQLIGRCDLVFERGFGDRGFGDVRAERDVDGDHLVTGCLLLCRQALNRPLVQAEDVGNVGHADGRSDESVGEALFAGTGASVADGSFSRVTLAPALT